VDCGNYTVTLILIKARRDEMIGHIIRQDNLTKNVIGGDVESYFVRGRIEYIKQINEVGASWAQTICTYSNVSGNL